MPLSVYCPLAPMLGRFSYLIALRLRSDATSRWRSACTSVRCARAKATALSASSGIGLIGGGQRVGQLQPGRRRQVEGAGQFEPAAILLVACDDQLGPDGGEVDAAPGRIDRRADPAQDQLPRLVEQVDGDHAVGQTGRDGLGGAQGAHVGHAGGEGRQIAGVTASRPAALAESDAAWVRAHRLAS